MIESLSDKVVDKLKAEFLEAVSATVDVTLQFVEEASYAIALFGGGITIMMKMAGSERAMKYFWGIQIGYVFIKGILGDLV